ncbi:hypothetical protein BE20_04675 [Sorangium cellulosum]|nr:hypothetical protein BE20_04675 [Sorangium cellulosum]
MVQRVRTLLVLLLLLACPRVAWAQRVLVVRPPPRDSTLFEAFGRLCAELALQSFEVIVLESPARSPGAEELERKAQESEAFAAVALRQRHGRRGVHRGSRDREDDHAQAPHRSFKRHAPRRARRRSPARKPPRARLG